MFTKSKKFEILGYTHQENNPQCITGIILGDKDSKAKLKVSAIDALRMADEGYIDSEYSSEKVLNSR